MSIPWLEYLMKRVDENSFLSSKHNMTSLIYYIGAHPFSNIIYSLYIYIYFFFIYIIFIYIYIYIYLALNHDWVLTIVSRRY